MNWQRIQQGVKAIALTIVGLACFAVDATAQSFYGQARDSANLRFVEHSSIPSTLPVWVVGATPDLRIGSREGGGPQLFGQVGAVIELANGTIVVADRQADELRAFSPTGAHLWTSGRQGAGPGEFLALLSALPFKGDSILAVELRRSKVFDASGVYVREITQQSPSPQVLAEPTVKGVLQNGTLVGTLSILSTLQGAGYVRGWGNLVYFSGQGAFLRMVGTFPLFERETTQPEVPGVGRISVARPIQMTRELVVGAGRDRVVAGDQSRFELHYFDAVGGLILIARVKTELLKPDRGRLDAASPDPPENRLLPETLPAHGKILVDSEGRAWVQEYVPPYEERVPQWWVFGRVGEFVARVEFPDRFEPHQIRDSYVLGVATDEFDVTYVERRSIY